MQQSSYAEAYTVGAGLAPADAAGEFFSGAGACGAGAAFGEGVTEGAEFGAFAGPAGILVGAAVGALVVYAWKKRPDMEGMTAPPRCRHFKSGGEPDV